MISMKDLAASNKVSLAIMQKQLSESANGYPRTVCSSSRHNGFSGGVGALGIMNNRLAETSNSSLWSEPEAQRVLEGTTNKENLFCNNVDQESPFIHLRAKIPRILSVRPQRNESVIPAPDIRPTQVMDTSTAKNWKFPPLTCEGECGVSETTAGEENGIGRSITVHWRRHARSTRPQRTAH
ncbi:hypothetical protein fugu_012871 [Takifugu bimaculatus]|uniref:Uncharacterized protein n=1 Tax=Takifugu bimaculatus TaxID=433685 RepID=A0A4Z2C6Q9_9TELE|nr:hypothetical protein fugu_012871 [Takifugu bimaculatus]